MPLGPDALSTRVTRSTAHRRFRPKSALPRRRRSARWWPVILIGLIGPVLVMGGVLAYLFTTLSTDIDRYLADTRARTLPRLYARPLVVRRNQSLTDRQLIARLNDLGYTQRTRVEHPGEFAIGRQAVALVPREGPDKGRLVRILFSQTPRAASGRVREIRRIGQGTAREIELGAPLITSVVTSAREKRRQVPLVQIPTRMRQAVLAIEDRRFHTHPGVDVIRTLGAAITNVRGDRPYLVGGSTLTQQIVKNSLLTPEKSYWRKLQEAVMSIILERRLSKDHILELYLNDVYLGQRGSFAVRGGAEGARLFFGKDVSNVTLSEAATIAGVIQAPQTYSPFRNPTRARERRNVVLHAMAETGAVTPEAARRAASEPLVVLTSALDNEAPYFVDHVVRQLGSSLAHPRNRVVDVRTTLDLHLQRIAQDAVVTGLARVDKALARRRGRPRAQAALVAVDPRNGEILALVGGRSYTTSQYNRATAARRQPGSVFKPFVYLAAFERAREEGRTDITPATIVTDEPTTFDEAGKSWTPANFDNEYDGPITFRRALARSRNVATIKVAELAGYDRVASCWRRVGAGTPARPYPSIALGVFEATPVEIAEAYTVFPNLGDVRPLRAVTSIGVDGRHTSGPGGGAARHVASPQATFLVTHMMRSVLGEGTAASARAAGFSLDAAGKTGTTNDLRDAWFVGFTPELLTVVWVGLDNNQPLGLSGTQAALPIWTSFMRRALAGHGSVSFFVPSDISLVEIDPDTGERAGPSCPTRINEGFLSGTEPTTLCTLHHGGPLPLPLPTASIPPP
jgi:penicillin-binding protein 1B